MSDTADPKEETNAEAGKDSGPTASAAPEKPVEKGNDLTPRVFSKEVVIPSSGEKMTVKRLKAGDYYKAQDVYIQWLQEMNNVLSESIGVDNLSKVIKDDDGNIDVKKAEAIMRKKGRKENINKTLEASRRGQEYRFEVVAIGLGITSQELLEQYYSEDVDLLFSVVSELNNFMGNLKKSAALTPGAKKDTKQ